MRRIIRRVMPRTARSRRRRLAIKVGVGLGIVSVMTTMAGCAVSESRVFASHDFASALMESMRDDAVNETENAPDVNGARSNDMGSAPRRNAVDIVRRYAGPDGRRPDRREVANILRDVSRSTPLDDDAFFAAPRSLDELALSAWRRHPAVRRRRAELEVVLERYDQVDDLGAVVAQFRAFTRGTNVRGGPQAAAGSKRRAAWHAPESPIEALSAQIVDFEAEEAWQRLRHEVAERIAVVIDSATHLVHARAQGELLVEHVELLRRLEPIVESRVVAGRSPQADLFAVRRRIATIATKRTNVLAREEALVVALVEAIGRRCPSHAPKVMLRRIELEAEPSILGLDMTKTATATVTVTVTSKTPSVRRGRARRDRTATALRLAEIMTAAQTSALGLPGGRFERGLGGEVGVAVARSPRPSRPWPGPRAPDLGSRTAFLHEMRGRVNAAEHAVAAAEREVKTRIVAVQADHRAATDRLRVHRTTLVPLARRGYEGLEGAYRGGRTAFVDVSLAAERLVEARLGEIAAERDVRLVDAAWLRTTGTRIGEGS